MGKSWRTERGELVRRSISIPSDVETERLQSGDRNFPDGYAGKQYQSIRDYHKHRPNGHQAGSFVVSMVSSPLATWTCLIVLLAIHLKMNHAAVRAVSMRSLNRQRANIVFSNLFATGKVLTPREVSKGERIFERDGVLRWADDRILCRCRIGVPWQQVLERIATKNERTGSFQSPMEISQLLELFSDEQYVLWYDRTQSHSLIVLKKGATSLSQLKAWAHALLLAGISREVILRKEIEDLLPSQERRQSLTETLGLINDLRASYSVISKTFDEYAKQLKAAGWDLEIAALETMSGTRISFD